MGSFFHHQRCAKGDGSDFKKSDRGEKGKKNGGCANQDGGDRATKDVFFANAAGRNRRLGRGKIWIGKGRPRPKIKKDVGKDSGRRRGHWDIYWSRRVIPSSQRIATSGGSKSKAKGTGGG